MTPAGSLIAKEIEGSGPILFSRFMQLALYDPEHGYYRSKDPFGIDGDFYTAEQLQPVFGRIVAATLKPLVEEVGVSVSTLIELGAGQCEMGPAFKEFSYLPIDVSFGVIPSKFAGVVFSNEFFDAIPVDVVRKEGEEVLERRVGMCNGHFCWTNGNRTSSDIPLADGEVRELQLHRLAWLRQIDSSLERGFVVTIDYGYTHRELVRFPHGTLMAYRKHQAVEDVLADPGSQDITAHVDFTRLEQEGTKLGWKTVRFESLAQMILRAGEADGFESATRADTKVEELRHRLQLKSLLFGMGETFRVLVQQKLG